MIDILAMSADTLAEGGFVTERISLDRRLGLVFEDPTVLGFLLVYGHASEMIEEWVKDSTGVIASHQLGLRRAGQKAWNTYVVLLAAEPAEHPQLVALAAIEEDLTGTRKIARSGIRDQADVRTALLALLPLQSAPKLEAVDIVGEIRARTTELEPRVVDAFVSNAEEAVVLQVLEQAP